MPDVEQQTGLTETAIAQLQAEVARLLEELARHEREAASKEHQLERYAADLRETFKQERARSLELQESYMATVRALSNAVEARDSYTAKHAERVAAYSLTLGQAMGLELSADPATEFGFLLHDVGKVAISDAILYKPGKLTCDERAEMQRHPVVGASIVAGIGFLGVAAEVVRHHHERWDGEGYPDKLAGEQIPLAARVFAVADVLDALTTDRPYRARLSWAQARAEIMAGAGSHFDPAVVAAFDEIPDETFARIAEQIG